MLNRVLLNPHGSEGATGFGGRAHPGEGSLLQDVPVRVALWRTRRTTRTEARHYPRRRITTGVVEFSVESGDEAAPEAVGDGLSAVTHPELAEQPTRVRLDRVL